MQDLLPMGCHRPEHQHASVDILSQYSNYQWHDNLREKHANSTCFKYSCHYLAFFNYFRGKYNVHTNQFGVVQENVKPEVLKVQTELARSVHLDRGFFLYNNKTGWYEFHYLIISNFYLYHSVIHILFLSSHF